MNKRYTTDKPRSCDARRDFYETDNYTYNRTETEQRKTEKARARRLKQEKARAVRIGQKERKQERKLRTSNGKELHAEILREFCVDVQTNQRGVLQASPRKLDQELGVAGVV